MPEPLKDLAKSSEMLFPSGREDDYIVKVEQARLPVEAGEDAIHEAREGGRCVAKTEGDLIKLVQLATAGMKGSLCLITLRDGHLPIPALKAEGWEPSSPMESVEEVAYPVQRVGVFDGSCVKLSEIYAKTQATVLLPYHYHRRSPRTVGGADDVAGQHLLDLHHLLPSNSRVLSPIGLAERRPVGLCRVLQQRSTPEVVLPLAEDVAKLAKQVIQLLLLERRMMLW